ncbi:MAG TPA: hypothetical protein VEZ12_20865 [Herpetosiphonaceae bacterium]|nr:hypothetical protein [Herpetosiphonaceae bacterium]
MRFPLRSSSPVPNRFAAEPLSLAALHALAVTSTALGLAIVLLTLIAAPVSAMIGGV